MVLGKLEAKKAGEWVVIQRAGDKGAVWAGAKWVRVRVVMEGGRMEEIERAMREGNERERKRVVREGDKREARGGSKRVGGESDVGVSPVEQPHHPGGLAAQLVGLSPHSSHSRPTRPHYTPPPLHSCWWPLHLRCRGGREAGRLPRACMTSPDRGQYQDAVLPCPGRWPPLGAFLPRVSSLLRHPPRC